MKLQGKISNWNDDKGFGFVEPNGGGERAFVHIKAFKNRSRRPANGETIVYELTRDSSNRYRAENIRFALDTAKNKRLKKSNPFGYLFTIVFFTGLLASAAIGKTPAYIAGLYFAMSLVAFVAYAFDKSAAQNGRWRTKENTLHAMALLGGWPGAFLAQKAFRHKSSKQAFKSVYWATVSLNLGALLWLHTEKGRMFFDGLLPLINSPG